MAVQQVMNSRNENNINKAEPVKGKSIDEKMTDAISVIQPVEQHQTMPHLFPHMPPPHRDASSFKGRLDRSEALNTDVKILKSQRPARAEKQAESARQAGESLPSARAVKQDDSVLRDESTSALKNPKETNETKNQTVVDGMPRHTHVVLNDKQAETASSAPAQKQNAAQQVTALMVHMSAGQTPAVSPTETKSLHYVFQHGDGKHSVNIQTSGFGDHRTVSVQPSNAFLGQQLRAEMSSQPMMGNVIFRDAGSDSQQQRDQSKHDDDEAEA